MLLISRTFAQTQKFVFAGLLVVSAGSAQASPMVAGSTSFFGAKTAVSATLKTPGQTLAGDLLVVGLEKDGAAATISIPSGWSRLGSVTDSLRKGTLYFYSKPAASTDASGGQQYTWSWTTGKTYASAAMFSLRGVSAIDSLTPSSGTSSASTLKTASTSLSAANELVVAFFHVNTGVTLSAVSPLLLSQAPASSGFLAGHVLVASSGASGSFSAYVGRSGFAWQTVAISFKSSVLASPSPTPSPSPSPSSTPSVPVIPASLFGMQTHGSQEWPTVSFGFLGKGSQTLWPYIESSRGVRDWSVLDGYVSTAKAKGIPMMYTFEFTPAWAISGASSATCETLYTGRLACPQPPDNMADWTNFVSALVSRYCPSGTPEIPYYELWNEPYDVYGSQKVQLSPADLAKMTHAAYGIIRSTCPAAKIISPSMATVTSTSLYYNYAKSYFAALGPVGTDPVDVASVHIYTYDEAVNTPEDVMPGGALNNPSLYSLIAQYAPNKPIWNTEGSWQSSTVGLFASDNLHAAFIARWYLLHWSAGIRQANWYAWDDGSLGTLCNHISGTSTCNPITIPVEAYQQTFNWMAGSKMTTTCAKVSASSTVWTCGLTTSAGVKTWAVWNTAGSSSYTVPAGYAHYKDLAGNTNTISGGTVTLGAKPILLIP